MKTTSSGRWLLSLTALSMLACSSNSSSSSQTQASAPPPSLSEAPLAVPPEKEEPKKVAEPGRECLPVVAAECACVYSCGVGVLQSDGRYKVRHEFWKDLELDARIAQWCVGDDCTKAFHADIVCSGICAPKAADSSCGFVGGRCVSGDAAD